MTDNNRYVRVAALDDVQANGICVVHAEGQTIALVYHQDQVYAVDNRCPHMGFPLHQGSVCDGILTCPWHHARFDIASGGTFDPWADDVRAYPVRVENGEVLVGLGLPAAPPAERYRARLADGLKHNLRLVIAKAVIGLHETGAPEAAAVEVGADFAVRHAADGWGPGLTILTAMANILPHLNPEDRPRALYQGLMHVARETAGKPPAFRQHPLPNAGTDSEHYKRWFRQFVEVRNADGAERTLTTAVAVGLPMRAVADIIFSAITDHLYLDVGHCMDFANKAFELLDLTGWEYAEQVLPSLVVRMARASRSEESSSWRHPIDLARLLWSAWEALPDVVEQGKKAKGTPQGHRHLIETLLGGDPEASVQSLKDALACGATFEQMAGVVAFAAARRIAQFHTSNEYSDWDTVLHTFTYANAVHQAIRRAPSVELLRGVFDAAMSLYLDRFLNTPPAALPLTEDAHERPFHGLLDLFDRQQQVNEAGRWVSDFLATHGADADMLAVLGHALLREDADFHTFQVVEAGFRQYAALRGTDEGRIVLIAVARYLAAHCPTPRAIGQTYNIAMRLHRGEKLYAG